GAELEPGARQEGVSDKFRHNVPEKLEDAATRDRHPVVDRAAEQLEQAAGDRGRADNAPRGHDLSAAAENNVADVGLAGSDNVGDAAADYKARNTADHRATAVHGAAGAAAGKDVEHAAALDRRIECRTPRGDDQRLPRADDHAADGVARAGLE